MPKRDRQTYTKSTHTRAIVKIHDRNGPPIVFLPETVTDDKSIDSLSDQRTKHFGGLLSVSTNKTIGEPAGTFQIVFKKAETLRVSSLLKLIEDPEGLWVEILFQVDGEIIDTMLGIADVLKESSSRNPDGGRVETYTLSGSDFGKVFVKTAMFANPYMEGAMSNYAAIWDVTGGVLVGAPGALVESLINIWLKNPSIEPNQAWRLPSSLGGRPFYERLYQNIQAKGLNAGMAYDVNYFNMSRLAGATPLWDSLVEYSHPLLNEIIVDLQPKPPENIPKQDREDSYYGRVTKRTKLFPGFILRERPFPTSRSRKIWDSLPRHTLEFEDIQNHEITKGGPGNRYNYWRLTLQGIKGGLFAQSSFMVDSSIGGDTGEDTSLGKPGSGFILHQKSVLDHGVRPYAASTRFLPYDFADNREGSTGDRITEAYKNTKINSDVAANWLRKLHDWYAIAHLQMSGTITSTRIFPEIRIGTVLKEKRLDGVIEYYVEGVANNWTYGSNGSTALTLTRGEYDDSSLLKDLYKREFETEIVNQDLLTQVDAIVGAKAVEDLAEDVLKDLESETVGKSTDSPYIDEYLAADEEIETSETKQAKQLAEGNSDALAPKEAADIFGEEALNEESLIGTEFGNPDPIAGLPTD